MLHSLYQDGENHKWYARRCRLFIFAYKNNMGTVADAGNGWKKIPLATGKTLAWAGFETYDPGLNGSAPPNHSDVTTNLLPVTTGHVPLAMGFDESTLQTLTGPISFQIVDHPTTACGPATWTTP